MDGASQLVVIFYSEISTENTRATPLSTMIQARPRGRRLICEQDHKNHGRADDV